MRVKHAKENNASKYVTRPRPKMLWPMILIPLMALGSTYLKICRKMRFSYNQNQSIRGIVYI